MLTKKGEEPTIIDEAEVFFLAKLLYSQITMRKQR